MKSDSRRKMLNAAMLLEVAAAKLALGQKINVKTERSIEYIYEALNRIGTATQLIKEAAHNLVEEKEKKTNNGL